MHIWTGLVILREKIMKFSIKINLVLLLLLSFQSYAINNNSDEPVSADKAFVSEVTVKDANTLIASWTIIDATYLYRKEIKIKSADKTLELGEYTLPPGKMKKDPLFGEVKIFRNRISVEIPISKRDRKAGLVSVETHWQGCADIGICYPPQKKTHSVMLMAANAATNTSAAESSTTDTKSANSQTDDAIKPGTDNAAPVNPESEAINPEAINKVKQLGNNLGLNDDENEILPVDKAFIMAPLFKNNTFSANWTIAEGYYLYRDKFQINVKSGDIKLGTITIPKGKQKKDPLFGNVEVFYKATNLTAELAGSVSEKTIELEIIYQGCAEAGLCYPPVRQIISLNNSGITGIKTTSAFDAIANTKKQTATSDPQKASTTGTGPASAITSTDAIQPCDQGEISELGKLEKILKQGNYWIIIGVFLIAGLGLAFTPCVFPMIPILMSIIAGQGSNISTKKAFSLSLVYVLSMAVVYTSVGVLAGMLGKNLNSIFNDPIAISIFVAIFIILAMSMFGVFSFQMPGTVQNKLTEMSNKQEGGSYLGVMVMGFLAALIAGPCVAAPLAAALIFIGQEGSATLGGIALFSMSIGMGIPLLILGTGGGKYLPKAGAWMDRVKMFFGIGLLALAIYLLDRLDPQYMPEHFILILSGILALFTAMAMGLFNALKENATAATKFWKLLSILVLVIGIIWIVGGVSKGDNLLSPLSHLTAEKGEHLTFKRVNNLDELVREVNAAKAQNKTVMLDFYADWCIECKRMEKTTFSNPEVQKLLANTVLLQADVTKDNPDDQRLRNQFNIPGPPAILFFNRQGVELKRYRFFGYMQAAPFAKLLQRTLCD